MIEILSHRGIGFNQPENSLASFDQALKQGFGLEIDVRMRGREVVISHDPPTPQAATLADVTELLQKSDRTIAVHLKEQSEQVWRPVCEVFQNRPNIFLFDPTIETAKSIKKNFPKIKLAFSVGEEHFSPTIYLLDEVLNLPECDNIWWDEWVTPGSVYNQSQLAKIQAAGKQIHVISPELHKTTTPPHQHANQPALTWKELLKFEIQSICTDFPKELQDFINRN